MDKDKLPEEYVNDLKSGYYTIVNGRKCLKSKFIVEYPQKIAKRLEHSTQNSLSQIWKFYDHARKIQDNLKQKGEPLVVMKAELDRLKPAVQYALNRNMVTNLFNDYIAQNVSQIKDIEDLDAFIKHFQSLIAYLPRKNQK